MRFTIISAGILFVLCAAGLHQAKGEDTNCAGEVVCCLKYVPEGFNLPLSAETTTSIKETNGPDFGKRSVSRGIIKSGEKDANQMFFVWDRAKSKLYFDLNNNLDLTDDANGTFTGEGTRAGYFKKIHIEKQIGQNRVPYTLHAFFFRSNYFQFTVNSGFVGQADLGGKLRKITFVDNMDGVASEGDYFSVISIDSNFGPLDYEFGLPAPKEVFLDGRNWLVSYDFATVDGQPCVQTKFKEVPKETGKIKIEGKFIRYMTFRDGRLVAVYENPQGEVLAPQGNLRISQLYLDGGKAGLFERRRNPRQDLLEVKKDQIVTLTAGGTLKNNVEVERVGRILQLAYKLTGADGKEYTSINRDRENAPEFAVFKGDKQIGSGVFKFG